MRSQLSQGCYVHVGAIAAAHGAAHALQGLSIQLDPARTRRLLYTSFVVDDVSEFQLWGQIDFRKGGQTVHSIPVILNNYASGWGQYNAQLYGDQVGCLPAWNCTRRAVDWSSPGLLSLPNDPLFPGALVKSWLYQDSVGDYQYKVVMAPLPFDLEADEVTWTPTQYWGVPKNAVPGTTMCAVVLAVKSDD